MLSGATGAGGAGAAGLSGAPHATQKRYSGGFGERHSAQGTDAEAPGWGACPAGEASAAGDGRGCGGGARRTGSAPA